jgi:ATP-binding cassette, subfamily F, member 2
MSSKWHQKKEKLAELEFERSLLTAPDDTTRDLTTPGAMGQGEEALFEKKLSKEEKKAAAKAAREAKRKAKSSSGSGGDDDEDGGANSGKALSAEEVARLVDETTGGGGEGGDASPVDDGVDHEQTDRLAAAGTICTYAASRKGVDARSRDINVTNFTLQHMGNVLLDETSIVLNHGNRYGLIGRNGCGKSTLLKALGARAVPIPRGIDIFFLDQEVEPSDTLTALDAVMSVDEERTRLEQVADDLNHVLTELAEAGNDAGGGNDDGDGPSKTLEEQQEEIMEALNSVYERLDALDAATAEVRARGILKGLGFTHEMQSKLTKDFSGGWRMRVSLARALFLQPVCLLLDEPTNHLDMEAVIWLEDYLSRWNRILFLVSHSQDFLNNVCTHMVHFTNKKKLQYYDGNYDQFMKTKSEKEENQWKQYRWEQEQIKAMKEYIARFGHGTAKNARQAQSKEKVLEKMVRAGLTDKPEEEKPLNFQFTNPGHLPPPVLAFRDVSFAYPRCEALYTNVNLAVDLDSRVALVGPNGAVRARRRSPRDIPRTSLCWRRPSPFFVSLLYVEQGKTTLIKLMAGELIPTRGDIRPHGHLKLGRFTQHFIDVLDLDQTPLDFFEATYPKDSREDLRKHLGRFGISGSMQVQRMGDLSDGQKSRVVLAKLGKDVPHILLMDEPTNHLDMEGIDALAKAINEFEGGLVLVSHDMRLISQVAKEIWMCDHKKIEKYKGDIQSFKMDMRKQMGIEGEPAGKLRGDASVKKQEAAATNGSDAPAKKAPSKLEVVAPPTRAPTAAKISFADDDSTAASTAASSEENGGGRYVPLHLRRKQG